MTGERRRPTHAVLVPSDHVNRVLHALITNVCTFTAEPSPHGDGTWYVGVLDDGVRLLAEQFGPMTDVGTLGDFL